MKFLILFLCFNLLQGQIIRQEDFNSYANGTRNSVKFTSAANNCDADGVIGTINGNYRGVFNGEFRCNDIEGLTCCSGGIGNNDNYWLSETINISLATQISISVEARVVGDVECTNCSNGGDRLVIQYQINSGVWTSFLTICGANSGFSLSDCIDISSGSTLKIRVLLGNQANDENYFFDNIVIKETACNPMEIKLEEIVEQVDKQIADETKYYDLLGKEIAEPVGFFIQVQRFGYKLVYKKIFKN